MPLIVASIVVPILLIWVIYKVIRLFFMTAETVHEAKKEDKEYADYLKQSDSTENSAK